MEQSTSADELYYILYKKDYQDILDGSAIAGFIMWTPRTFGHIQTLYPKAIANGTWSNGDDDPRIMWLVSAESLHTPPTLPAVPVKEMTKKDDFQEELRIYWTSLIASFYERLNDTGKAIVHQYLKEKPWADQKWFWTPLSFSNEVFLRLVLKIGFEADNGIEHLQELGARLKTIYSFDMNKKSGEGYFSIPKPPVRVEPPKPEVAVVVEPQTPMTIPVTKEEKTALIKRAMNIYQLLGEKGYKAIHQFLTMPPRPGQRNGPGRFPIRSSVWFKNLLSYLTPEELKTTAAKLEEIFCDDNNVDDTELARRVKAKTEGAIIRQRLLERYRSLNVDGFILIHAFLITPPMTGSRKVFTNAMRLVEFQKLLLEVDGQPLKDLDAKLEEIFRDDKNVDVMELAIRAKSNTGKESNVDVSKDDLVKSMETMYDDLTLEGMRALGKFMQNLPWAEPDSRGKLRPPAPSLRHFSAAVHKLVYGGDGIEHVKELSKHLKVIYDTPAYRRVHKTRNGPPPEDILTPIQKRDLYDRMSKMFKELNLGGRRELKRFMSEVPWDRVVEFGTPPIFKAAVDRLLNTGVEYGVADVLELEKHLVKIHSDPQNLEPGKSSSAVPAKADESEDLDKKRMALAERTWEIYNAYGWKAFDGIVKLAGGENFKTFTLKLSIEKLETLLANMEKIAADHSAPVSKAQPESSTSEDKPKTTEKRSTRESLLAGVKTAYASLNAVELDKLRALCKWSYSVFGYWHLIENMTFEELIEVATLIGRVKADPNIRPESKEEPSKPEPSEKEKRAEQRDDRKGLLVGLHKLFCSLNQHGMALLREHFEATGKKDFGWHLIEPMTFEELSFIWGVIDSIVANPRNLERWATVPTPGGDKPASVKDDAEPKGEPAPLTKEESMAICDRAYEIYRGLRREGYVLVHTFLTSPPMPIHKGFFEKDYAYDERALGKALAVLTDRELKDLLAKMEEIFLDDNNVDVDERKSRAKKEKTAALMARANQFYREFNADGKQKAYKVVCDIFWGGWGEHCTYLDDSAFETATSAFTHVNAQILVDILKQISADPISTAKKENIGEEERLRIISKAIALFRKLNMDGLGQLCYLMDGLHWLNLDKTANFTPAYFESLLATCGLWGIKEILQIVEEVSAKPEYRSSDNEEANKETKNEDEEERLRLAEEARKLFSDLCSSGRDAVDIAMRKLSWIEVNEGMFTSQCFGELIRTLPIQYVKELKKIVEEVHAVPANRCLRPN